MKQYCPMCNKFKQAKFFVNEEHRYCKTCENQKPELKKWRKINGHVVKM